MSRRESRRSSTVAHSSVLPRFLCHRVVYWDNCCEMLLYPGTCHSTGASFSLLYAALDVKCLIAIGFDLHILALLRV